MNRTAVLATVVIVIIVVASVSVYLSTRPIALSVSVATSTSVATAGSPITFTAIPTPSSASIGSVVWSFGDGSNETETGPSVTHTFSDGGRYLIFAQVTATYQSFLFSSSAVGSNNVALFPLTVQPNLTQDQAQEASVPTVNFPSATNPTAPVFSVGDVVQPVGGFLEAPANSNWTIQEYAWDFGNGNKQSVSASNATGLPSGNVTAAYANSGLYPLSLTLTTTSNGASLSVTTVRTVAVQSSTLPFALLTTSSGSPNPGVITVAEVTPGGPYSWDPQIDYDIVGLEQMQNIFQTLVDYNGSSTVSFIPTLAAALPTQANGGISQDYMTYTFQIRSNQSFSNGDPVTAYDVWFSMARDIAFTSGTGTPGWIQTQFLIPGVQNGTANVDANNTWAATRSVTYDNASNTVTFHFNRPMPPTLAFQVLADPQGAAIIDSRYAWSVGAGFDEANFESYKNQSISGSYNFKMQWSPIGSGPYMIQSYTPGQSVELVPNPHYGGVPGIPSVSTVVVIDWVKTADTALLMLQDGEADSASGLPSSDFPAVQKLQSQGLVNIYNLPSFWLNFYVFNIEINKAMEASYGTGFNEPSNYFADLPTRLAWIDAFDYAGYLNNILGNAKYGTTFGTGFQGAIPAGMLCYIQPDELGGLPAQNLDDARGNYSISAWANQKITVPIFILTADPVDLAAAEEWAGTLSQISNGNINAQIVQVTVPVISGLPAQDNDPAPVQLQSWAPDYPDPTDYVDSMYLQGGAYPAGVNWFPSYFDRLAPTTPNDLVHVNGTTYTQAQVYSWISGNVTLGDRNVDPAVRQHYYEIATKLAIYMGLYVYLYQVKQLRFDRTWLKGYASQENPITNQAGHLLFYWLTKG